MGACQSMTPPPRIRMMRGATKLALPRRIESLIAPGCYELRATVPQQVDRLRAMPSMRLFEESLRRHAKVGRTTLIRPARTGHPRGTGAIRAHHLGRRALPGPFRRTHLRSGRTGFGGDERGLRGCNRFAARRCKQLKYNNK